MKKVVVASKNPVKIQATQNAFECVFENQEFEYIGVSVNSGVSDQPMSSNETLDGAKNRANNAKETISDADYWVGLESGLEDTNGQLEVFAWMCIISRDGQLGIGRTGSFFLPTQVSELVLQGMELGDASDIFFKQENTKHKTGVVGLLTNELITRESYYITALIFALIPFLRKDLY